MAFEAGKWRDPISGLEWVNRQAGCKNKMLRRAGRPFSALRSILAQTAIPRSLFCNLVRWSSSRAPPHSTRGVVPDVARRGGCSCRPGAAGVFRLAQQVRNPLARSAAAITPGAKGTPTCRRTRRRRTSSSAGGCALFAVPAPQTAGHKPAAVNPECGADAASTRGSPAGGPARTAHAGAGSKWSLLQRKGPAPHKSCADAATTVRVQEWLLQIGGWGSKGLPCRALRGL